MEMLSQLHCCCIAAALLLHCRYIAALPYKLSHKHNCTKNQPSTAGCSEPRAVGRSGEGLNLNMAQGWSDGLALT
jgi:hypothetical protein